MSENNLKKTIMGGFDKQSVMDYVDGLNLKYSSRERELTQTIEQLSIENNSLKDQKNENSQKFEYYESEITELKNKVKEYEDKLEKLNMNLLESKKLEHDTKQKLVIMTEENNRLNNALVEAQHKANKFDMEAIEVGSVLINAKNSADKIIKEAMEDSVQIKDTTLENTKALSEELDSFKIDLSSLNTAINAVFNTFKGHLGTLACSIDKIQDKIELVSSIGEHFAEKPSDENTKKDDNNQ